MAIKNLMVRGGADFSGMKKAMENAQKSINDFKNNVNSSMKGIGAALASVGAGLFLKNAVTDAMKFEASVQQLNRLMGESAREFMDWANTTAGAFNMSKSEAVRYGATFSNIISTFAQNSSQTQKYTQDLLQATAVAASMTGRTMEDALERIRSGMLGNTEAVEDLGIFVNVAMIESTKAFEQFANGKSWDQLDFRTQQTIRYFAILEQAATKYGVEVGSNTMSATARFTAALGNLKLAIGQAFMPLWNLVLPVLTAFVTRLAQAMNIVAQFSQALFGKTSQQKAQAAATTQQASAVGNLGDAIKKTGKEAKKAQGSLAGFDEINSLADKSNSGGSGELDDLASGSVEILPTGEMPLNFDTNATQVSAKIQAMAEKVKQSFGEMTTFIKENKEVVVASLAAIATGFTIMYTAMKWAAIVGAVKKVGAVIVGALSGPILIAAAIALAIGAVVGAFVHFYKTNEKFRGLVDGILNKIKDAAIWLWQDVMVPFGKYMADVFTKAMDAVKVAGEWLWKNVFIPFGDFLLWFWNSVLLPIGAVLKDVLAVSFKAVSDVAKSLWENVLVPLGEFFKASFQPTIEALSAVFMYLWNMVLAPFGAYLGAVFKEIFKALVKVIEYLWHNVLKPLVPFLVGSFKSAFETIGEVIKGVQKIFVGLMDFITGVFTGDWEKAWNGVKNIFKGVFESLYAIVKSPLNMIIDAINKVIGGLNSISIDIPDWVPEHGGKTFGISIPKIPKLARGGIVSSPTIAQIGEAGKEMVVPLENTSFVDKLASALGTAVMSAMQFNNGSSANGDVIIQLEGTTLARVINPYLAKENNRIGKTLISTT